jgi:ubiquinone/menaquinone biosynthesis C-methylase UbiE
MTVLTSARARQIHDDAEHLLRCPACHATELSYGGDAGDVVCAACQAVYTGDADGGWCSLIVEDDNSEVKQNIRAWWGDLYRQLYADNDAALTPELYARQLEQLEDFFNVSDHLAVTEMPLKDLQGKKVLEIGSGSGAHSALFKKHGAEIVSVDLTPERVVSTALKFSLVEGGKGRAYQADGENLPFRDGQFDIVYSNGVLHHSENTDKCISEVFRVLKPGGLAVLMLYSRHSANVWFNIFPRGVIGGAIFRHPQAEWMGLVTEGKPSYGIVKNPVTRVYSAAEIQNLLYDFEILGMRKVGWEWDQFAIPRLTQFRRAVMKALGFPTHDGGIPVAGVPRMPPSRFERWLSRYIGFGWDIKARKPETDVR